MKGVITADVVGSTQIKIEDRGTLPALLNELIREIAQCRPELKLQVDIFRGDSFQVWVEKPEYAPLVALLLRAGLRMSALRAGEQQLDARISVGIGDVAYRDATVSQSDGEAFVLSGRGFDQLGKQQRLMVQTPSETTNEELRVETATTSSQIGVHSTAKSCTKPCSMRRVKANWLKRMAPRSKT